MLEGLAQHHFVIIAAPHALAHRLHVGHVLFRRVVGDDRAGRALLGRRDFFGVARQARGGDAVAREIVLVALDLLLLAVHEPDVVAQEQVQVLVAVARQFLFDGLELEQQVVAERADQAQARILFAAELLDERAQNARTPKAACCAPLRRTARAAASTGRA